MDEKEIGLKIKQLRSEYSLKIGEKFTQEKLAKKLKISRGYLSDIESGRTKPSDDILKKIAIACDSAPSELLDYSSNFYISYEKLKLLRKIKQLTQKELNQILNVTDKNIIGKIERVEISVDDELLTKLSLFFNVSKEFLISMPDGSDEITRCPICKNDYYPFVKSEYCNHEITHRNFIKSGIQNIYIDLHKDQNVKEECRHIIFSGESSLLDKYTSAIKYFQCYYSRSMRDCNFSSSHVSFEEFIAMLLNQKGGVCDEFSKDLLNLLIKQFGKTEGIPDGESYAPLKIINHENTKEESILLSNYEMLNDTGKEKLIEYSNDLIETPKYIDVKNNVTELISTTPKKEEYNFAAHADGLDGETAKMTAEKAKAIFKQMDE